jgi:hypothetical protein
MMLLTISGEVKPVLKTSAEKAYKQPIKKVHSRPTVLTKKVLARPCSPATRQG